MVIIIMYLFHRALFCDPCRILSSLIGIYQESTGIVSVQDNFAFLLLFQNLLHLWDIYPQGIQEIGKSKSLKNIYKKDHFYTHENN